MSEHILLFLIANSFFITIFPLVYLHTTYEGLSEHEREQSRVSAATLNLIIPLAMGVLFPILYSICRTFIPRKIGSGLYIRFDIAGGLTALTVSFVLDYLGVYEHWFEFENSYTVHAGVFVLYFCIFQILGIWVYKRVSAIFDDYVSSSSGSSRSSIPPRLPTPNPASFKPPESTSSRGSGSLSSNSSLSSAESTNSKEIVERLEKYSTPNVKNRQ